MQVEAKLQFLVKPDRHVIQFVLESVCVLPTLPVRPTTARPTAMKTGTRRTPAKAPKSVFDSIDLTDV